MKFTKVPGTQFGSNSGGVHLDEHGDKHYVKHYSNADQAKTEVLAGKITQHLGAPTLGASYHEINGKPSIVTRWNPHVKTQDPSKYQGKLSENHARQLARMYHAAVLTKNWDVVGLEHDNIVHNKNTGSLHSIDHGGAFDYRAQGGHKPYGPDINELASLRDQHLPSGKVFNNLHKHHADIVKEEGKKLMDVNPEHIHHIFKNSGRSDWEQLHNNFKHRLKALQSHYQSA